VQRAQPVTPVQAHPYDLSTYSPAQLAAFREKIKGLPADQPIPTSVYESVVPTPKAELVAMPGQVQTQTQTGNTTGVPNFFKVRGDQPITSSSDPRLTTVSVGNQNWQVNREAAPSFQGFLSDLKNSGAPVTTSGGWNYRTIAGTKTLSEHAYGGAIDVSSQGRNAVTPEFAKWMQQNPGKLQELERKWNIYGGERFSNPDLSHFEWGGVPLGSGGSKVTQATTSTQAAAPTNYSATKINSILGNGQLAGSGQKFVDAAAKYNLNPYVLAAISAHETGYGTSAALKQHNNVAGMMDMSSPNATGLQHFNSVDEGIDAFAKLVREKYADQGLTTIGQMWNKYAPYKTRVANDPRNLNRFWGPNVSSIYRRIAS
jgi:hypothetical protein